MKYTKEFIKKAQEDLIAFSENKNKYQEYSIELPDGFANVPIIEICRLLNDGQDIYFQEKITKLAIMGKKVIIKLDDKEIGTFILNSVSDKWEAFKLFEDFPLALENLIQTVIAYLIKKLLPPPKNTKP